MSTGASFTEPGVNDPSTALATSVLPGANEIIVTPVLLVIVVPISEE